MAGLLRGMMLLTPPDLGGLRGGDVMSWAPLAMRLRRLGGDDMMELLRVLPMAVQGYLDEWFESDALKGALGGSAVIGAPWGRAAPGTNLMFLYQNLGGLLAHRFVEGGMGPSVARRWRQRPAPTAPTIRTGAGVERVSGRRWPGTHGRRRPARQRRGDSRRGRRSPTPTRAARSSICRAAVSGAGGDAPRAQYHLPRQHGPAQSGIEQPAGSSPARRMRPNWAATSASAPAWTTSNAPMTRPSTARVSESPIWSYSSPPLHDPTLAPAGHQIHDRDSAVCAL